MKTITLTNSDVAIVDDEDHEMLSRYTWRLIGRGYAARGTTRGSRHTGARKSLNIYMHHVVIGKIPPNRMEIDHINQDKLDNRKSNLRFVTSSSNKINRGPSLKNTSGVVGVNYSNLRYCWEAKIGKNGHSVWLGRFPTKEAAAAVRKAAERRYYPELWP